MNHSEFRFIIIVTKLQPVPTNSLKKDKLYFLFTVTYHNFYPKISNNEFSKWKMFTFHLVARLQVWLTFAHSYNLKDNKKSLDTKLQSFYLKQFIWKTWKTNL